MRNTQITPLFLVILLLLSMLSSCSKADEQTLGRPDSAAEFRLPTTKGEKVSLSEVLETKDTVLVFWTSGCYFCRRELPKLEQFYRENKEQVAVIGIDVGESKRQVESYARSLGLSYPLALDSDGRVARLYKVLGVPTIIAINQSGKILYYGYSAEEMRGNVNF